MPDRFIICALLAALVHTGCGPPAVAPPTVAPPTVAPPSGGSTNVQSASFRDLKPEQFLAAVFARYRNAASYRDQGRVQLSYRVGNRVESKVAPMRVWFDRNELSVDTYDVRIWSDRKGLTAWIDDDASDDFDSQVLVAAASDGRPTIAWLLADPILADRIAAGLAGPPPQLEWLFAAEPMKPLFQGDCRFEFGPSESIESHLCRSIRVSADQDRYEFWIDERTGLLRRVDLPSILAPAEPNQPAQTMQLSIELLNATFDAPVDPPEVHALPAQPTFVRRFVPLPPAKPPSWFGSRPPRFRLTDSTGQVTLSDRGSDRELTMLVRFSGDAGSLASFTTAAQWYQLMPSKLQQRVRVAVLVDEAARDALPVQPTLPVVIDQGDPIARSLELTPGGVVILDRHGVIAWGQPDLSPDTLVTLGAIVSDVLDGVDVPKRLHDQWREQFDAYQRVLREQLVHRK